MVQVECSSMNERDRELFSLLFNHWNRATMSAEERESALAKYGSEEAIPVTYRKSLKGTKGELTATFRSDCEDEFRWHVQLLNDCRIVADWSADSLCGIIDMSKLASDDARMRIVYACATRELNSLIGMALLESRWWLAPDERSLRLAKRLGFTLVMDPSTLATFTQSVAYRLDSATPDDATAVIRKIWVVFDHLTGQWNVWLVKLNKTKLGHGSTLKGALKRATKDSLVKLYKASGVPTDYRDALDLLVPLGF